MTCEHDGVSIKVLHEELEEPTERDGIVNTPYMARNNWEAVRQFSKLRAREWDHYVRQSYDIIGAKLPKKVQAGLH